MKTVKDVSALTGVSIRTLRYYDEIGLLKPTKLTESGYRLYDNEALAEATDSQFGKGCSEYVAYVIQHYYGV